MDDWQLLREYVERDSHAAFAEIVSRHRGLVHATCLRELGDAELAQDTCQAVFLVLARKAARLRSGTVLAGWLYGTARLAAKNARRDDARRRVREARIQCEMVRQQPRAEAEPEWEELEAHLHAALDSLRPRERDLILLRYLEGRSLREIGDSLGLSENAAHMRVARALEKLRGYFRRHGVPVSSAAFAGVLLAHAGAPASAAPPAGQITGPAVHRAWDEGQTSLRAWALTEGVLREMRTMLLKRVLAGVAACCALGGGVTGAALAFREPQPAPVAAGAVPSAADLLQRFADTQEKLRSFSVKCEVSGGMGSGQYEFRVDAKTGRFVSRIRSIEPPYYNSQTWDGKEYYSYSTAQDRPGNVLLDRTGDLNRRAGYLHQLQTSFNGAANMGYFRYDTERVDTLLKKARTLTLRPKTEPVEGDECYVVEGVTTSGKYTLWLDPQHGYHLARAEVSRRQGDGVLGGTLTAGSEVRQVLKDVRFKQVSGLWVPVECRQENRDLFPQRSPEPVEWQVRHKTLSIQINPDFSGARAFYPDDLREGARVYLKAPGAKQHPDYIWTAGKLEPFVN